MAQQSIEYFTGNYNDFTVKIPNVIIDFGNAKLHFDKQQITVDELLDVYFKLNYYLNTFECIHL